MFRAGVARLSARAIRAAARRGARDATGTAAPQPQLQRSMSLLAAFAGGFAACGALAQAQRSVPAACDAPPPGALPWSLLCVARAAGAAAHEHALRWSEEPCRPGCRALAAARSLPRSPLRAR
jgi:hypothetical protein